MVETAFTKAIVTRDGEKVFRVDDKVVSKEVFEATKTFQEAGVERRASQKASVEKRLATSMIEKAQRSGGITAERAIELKALTPVFERKKLVGFEQIIQVMRQREEEAAPQKETIGVVDIDKKVTRVPTKFEALAAEALFEKERSKAALQSSIPSRAKTLEELTSESEKGTIFFKTIPETGEIKEILRISAVEVMDKKDLFNGELKPRPSVISAGIARPSKVKGLVSSLGGEFKAGFSLRPSPSQLTSSEQFEAVLTGVNPKTGESISQFERGLKDVAFLSGFGTAAASNLIGQGIGGVLSKIPFVRQAATGIGSVVTSKPVVVGLTLLAGKELVEASKEGDVEFARTGFTILRDVALFGGAISKLPVTPLKTPLDKLFQFPLKFSRVEIPTAEGVKTFRSIGFDVGTRAQPLITQTPEGIKFGTPSIEGRIPISELTSPVSQPETALGGKIFKKALELTPKEEVRIESAVSASRILGEDIGLSPKEIFFNVKGLKSPKTASGIIERFTSEIDGQIFGSAVTQRLPEGFVSKEIGDVDIFAKSKSVKELQPKLEELTKELSLAGEDVIVKPESLSIEFTKGGKLLEVKSGVDQEVLGLGDIAPDKFLGFDIADTRGFKFGGTESISAGQQFLRKGSASLIVSPPSKAAEFSSFSKGGVIGKITPENPRGTKDIAGFIQTGEGLIALRETSVSPLTRAGGKGAKAELKSFVESFSPEQQVDINIKLKELTGSEFSQRFFSEIKKPVDVGGVLGSPRLSRTPEKFEKFVIDSSKIPLVESPASFKPSVSGEFKSDFFIPISDVSEITRRDVSPSVVSETSFIPVTSSLSVSKGRSSQTSKSPSTSLDSSISKFTSLSPSPSQISRSPSVSRSVSPSPSRISSFSSLSSLVPPSPSPFRKEKKRGVSLFDVIVGSAEGKFQFRGEGLSFGKAIQFGRGKVLESPAASFKIQRAGGGILSEEELERIEDRLGLKFRKSKNVQDVFVQKRKFRIGSAGEVRGISLVGAASQRKKGGFF